MVGEIIPEWWATSSGISKGIPQAASLRAQEISDCKFDLILRNEMPILNDGNDAVCGTLIDDFTRFSACVGNR